MSSLRSLTRSYSKALLYFFFDETVVVLNTKHIVDGSYAKGSIVNALCQTEKPEKAKIIELSNDETYLRKLWRETNVENIVTQTEIDEALGNQDKVGSKLRVSREEKKQCTIQGIDTTLPKGMIEKLKEIDMECGMLLASDDESDNNKHKHQANDIENPMKAKRKENLFELKPLKKKKINVKKATVKKTITTTKNTTKKKATKKTSVKKQLATVTAIGDAKEESLHVLEESLNTTIIQRNENVLFNIESTPKEKPNENEKSDIFEEDSDVCMFAVDENRDSSEVIDAMSSNIENSTDSIHVNSDIVLDSEHKSTNIEEHKTVNIMSTLHQLTNELRAIKETQKLLLENQNKLMLSLGHLKAPIRDCQTMQHKQNVTPRKKQQFSFIGEKCETIDELSPTQLNEVRNSSVSVSNFALNLTRIMFSEEERKTSNCRGTKNKKQLDPVKLARIEKAVFEYYPSPQEFRVIIWRKCIASINEGGRRNKSTS